MGTRMGKLRLIGCTLAALVACLVLYAVADFARSLYREHQYQKTVNRIPPSEVQADGLQLTRTTAGHYRLRGEIHNLSHTYSLYSARLVVVVQDCVNGECHEQAEGLADVNRQVPPGQSATFLAEEVILPNLASPLGERRLTSRVAYTRGGQ